MKSKYIIVFLGSLLFLSGCTSDWLDLKNPNLQTTATYWNTESQIEMGVNATYNGLLYDGTWMRHTPFALNLKSDDCQSFSPWTVLSLTGKFNLDYSDPQMSQWPWTAFYGIINRANQVLANIDNDEIKYSSQLKYNQYKGEACFLRGFAHYYLVTFFRNIPIITRPYESDEDLYPYQAQPAETWAQIISDFKAASELLPVSYDAANLGRATKGAALAFLGKSYLKNGDYANASTFLKQVIDLNVYSLVPNYEDNFTISNENNSESIFEIQLDRNVGGSNLKWVGSPTANDSQTSAHGITFAPTPFGFGDAAATRWIFNEFHLEKTKEDKVDERLLATISFDTSACIMYGKPFRVAFDASRWSEIFVRKYTNAFSTVRTNEQDWRSDINERVMRYAEVLMMYAECQFELGNKSVAAEYIQKVRDRVKLPDLRPAIAVMDQTAFYNQLSHEKALEFAMEGIRFEDIVRWGWLYDSNRLNELKSHDEEFASYIEGREYLPIPPDEMDKNPKYVQNAGW